NGGALGAARLAWLADGGSEAEVLKTPQVRQRFVPATTLVEMLDKRRARFNRLYGALRPVFAAT
ncbi:MAG: xylB, partial [Rhizobacter sp.]|nr:xylB [Rhizobacter sp.]